MALAPVFLWAVLALGSGGDAGDVATLPRPDSVRIEVAGYDSTRRRIYWRQMRSGAPVEVRYFDLKKYSAYGDATPQEARDPGLEGAAVWRSFKRGLVPLAATTPLYLTIEKGPGIPDGTLHDVRGILVPTFRTCDGGGPAFDVTVESTCEVTVGTAFYQVPERVEALLVVTTTNPACVQQSAVLLP